MSIPPSSISPGTVSCASCAVPFSQCQWCFGPEDYSDWPGAFGSPDDDELTSRLNRRLAFSRTKRASERTAIMSTVVGIIMEAERTSFLEEVLRPERFVDADRGDDRVISGASSRGNTSSRGDASSRSAPSTVNVPGGMPITHNFSGQPSVHVVGRGRLAKPIRSKPVQSMKSKIVPEPDQIQSEPPVRSDLPHRT